MAADRFQAIFIEGESSLRAIALAYDDVLAAESFHDQAARNHIQRYKLNRAKFRQYFESIPLGYEVQSSWNENSLFIAKGAPESQGLRLPAALPEA
jgi:hypothetical protein